MDYRVPDAARFTEWRRYLDPICHFLALSVISVADRTHNLVIKNTGHWGDRVYPGCGKIRNGFAKALEPVSYTNIYGGGGTSAVVGIGY